MNDEPDAGGHDPATIAAAVAAFDIVKARATGDDERTASLFTTIMEGPPASLFAACCVWTHFSSGLPMRTMPERDMIGSFMLISASTGEQIDIDELPPGHEPLVWAGRFTTAYILGDGDMLNALYAAAVNDPPVLGDGVFILLDGAAARWQEIEATRNAQSN